MTLSLKPLVTSVAVLLGTVALVSQTRHALVNVSVANLREQPSHAAELGSQQLMGFPVEVKSQASGWSEVVALDGYHGYIINNSLVDITEDDYDAWRRSQRLVYTAPNESKIWGDTLRSTVVSDVVAGCILTYQPVSDAWHSVTLPDGRQGFVEAWRTTDIERWSQQPFSPEIILQYAEANLGTPYLWGGISSKGCDCSGLTWTAYFLNGRIIQRNASAQAKLSAMQITNVAELRPADLLFFANRRTGRINHVALHIADGTYIESSGRIRYNSLVPASPLYQPANFLFGIAIAEALPTAATNSRLFLLP